MTAIFQGEQERKQRLTWIRDKSRAHICDKLGIDTPSQDVMSLICGFLPEANVSEERTNLISQAQLKFDRARNTMKESD